MTDSEEDESRSRRRIALLLLVAVVVLFGAGIGTITIFGPDGDTETPTGEPGTTPTSTVTANSTVTTTATPTNGTTADTPTSTTTPVGVTPTTTQGETETVQGTETSTPTPTRTATVTPTRTESDSAGAGGGGDGGTSDDQATVSLDAPDDATLLQTQNVVPGQSGAETVTLTNGGQQAGTIRLATVTVTDHENGIVGPEASVDDSPTEGELSEAVEVKLTFEYPDGERVIVAGSSSSYVSLSSLSGTAAPNKTVEPGQSVTVELDWRIDESVGNEIQSDGTTFDAVFELRAPES
ncbi:hypothetical protein [Halorhabdus salina]|uniref:hypothetical protein n=1 Tax=Halorhabdus salina TaxID=2750670 RepID=UPI0015EF0A07|nr:hypothetical protein [Halorhabdus salina]